MTRYRTLRVLYLALRDLRSHGGRSSLLVVMVCVGLLVFVFMTALAAASSDELGEAINTQFGVESVYTLSLPTDLAVSIDEIDATLQNVFASHSITSAIVVADFGSQRTACVPAETGDPTPLVTVLSSVSAERLAQTNSPSPGPSAPSGETTCLQGISTPVAAGPAAWAVAGLVSPYDPSVVLPRTALSDATAAFGRPARIVAYVQLLGDAASAATLTDAAAAAFTPIAQRSALGPDWSTTVRVDRIDDGAELRNAQRGVTLVYSAIGWAVLGLGAMALLVAQMMNIRNRVWFFGLSRVWGASPRDLVAIACAEVAILVGTASLIVVVTAAALTPSLDAWSQATFQAPLVVLRAETFAQLLVATAILAAVGALLPAYRAATIDPLDAVE